ncbi:hypothetical protein ACQ33O_13555 [Ferruginibacter sp. SUN002]|uniref:hypothetical protein n=1 Tax=Ferruginibacter sp. SUN002 TaxID=2937789 RepID=UPI003D36B0D1
MRRVINIQYFICITLLIAGCKEEVVDYNNNSCKGTTSFITKFGFQANKAYLSTSDKRLMGLLLEELPDPKDPLKRPRTYQHPSWKMAGWLGPMQIDNVGNVFLAPVPVVNVLHNKADKQNTLYRVDGQSGEMSVFMELSALDSSNIYNAYGILGFAYLCETNTLYVSSVAGSTRSKEVGVIYAIDINNKKIIDKLEGIDILGMGISYIEGKRKLYLGSARTSNVYSVVLTKEGKFSGKVEQAFTLENIGPRGDDKLRKIKIDTYGNLNVYGYEFNFNLIAPTEKQETVYEFIYDDATKKWNYSKILSNKK